MMTSHILTWQKVAEFEKALT